MCSIMETIKGYNGPLLLFEFVRALTNFTPPFIELKVIFKGGNIMKISRIISIVLETFVFVIVLAFQAWALEMLQADYRSATEALLSLMCCVGVASEVRILVEPYIERAVKRIFVKLGLY